MSAPQGNPFSIAGTEIVIAEVLNVAYINGTNNIFPSPIFPVNLGTNEQALLTINIAQDQNNAILSYTLDGTNFVVLGAVPKDVNTLFSIPVKEGDPLNLRLDKSAQIIYCRIGQPI